MQKVLVWKSYGDIDVFAAETAGQMEDIIKTIVTSISAYGMDKEISEITKHMKPNDRDSMVNVFSKLKNLIGTGHESFEDIFLTQVKDKCQ